MPISNTRIEQLTGTDFKLRVEPVKFELERNPENGDAKLVITYRQLLIVDGTPRNALNYGQQAITVRQWAVIQNLKPAYAGATDPVSGADLTQISMRGVMQILLDAFDRAYEQDNPPA